MRPVYKRMNNIKLNKYNDAKNELINQIGAFCSYCERYITKDNLHVEHIKPKCKYPTLELEWDNFLLSCVSCNSSKGTKVPYFQNLFFPDRDNTFIAFKYLEDGTIIPNPELSPEDMIKSQDTLNFLGFDNETMLERLSKKKEFAPFKDRMDAWLMIELYKRAYEETPDRASIKQLIINSVKRLGFFSIWMEIFKDHRDIKLSLIATFTGTLESGCFDENGNPISRPSNHLEDSGKI